MIRKKERLERISVALGELYTILMMEDPGSDLYKIASAVIAIGKEVVFLSEEREP